MHIDLPSNNKHLAVALSGGADSWALALLAQDWCMQNNAVLTAITVDHALRPESGAEATAVAAQCAARRIKHVILKWQHDDLSSGIQQKARAARYKLMTDYCHANNIPLLLTAHHADDQYETVLLRLAKASDVGGLGGLQALGEMHGVQLARPLLNYTKDQLREYVAAAGIVPIEDPSNQNAAYARARLRHARDVLEAEGLSPQNITRFAGKMQAADDALEYAAKAFIGALSTVHADGHISVPQCVFKAKPDAIIQRALLAMWRTVSGESGYPLGHDQLQRLVQFVQHPEEGKLALGSTLLQHYADVVQICREPAACAAAICVPAGNNTMWDDRFVIHNNSATNINVRALGLFGRDRIDILGPAYAWLHDVPPDARASLPANAATGLPLFLAKTAESDLWAEFLAVKSTETALYSA